ncbi:MAG: hypothetical protein N3A69_12180, partial [Leptospiraceae bacterium]|nr:hypothetical protein [Leptospiraceae bacterium]
MLKSIQLNELKLPFTEKNFHYSTNEKPRLVPFSKQTEKHLILALQNEKVYPHFAFLGNAGLGKKTILRKLILQFFKKEPVFDSFCSLSSWLGTYEEGR